MKLVNTLPGSLWFLLGAVFCAAGMWGYLDRVLIPYQVADAAAHDRPRGNLSDLYPRWLGAKELLLHGRDPYSSDVTREIQMGYYGRTLDAARPEDPKDQQGFAYPVYLVFLLAGTIRFPFPVVQDVFFWGLFLLSLLSTLMWLRTLEGPSSLWTQVGLLLLTLGSLSVVQGLKLEQMSLLVAGMLAVAAFLLVRGYSVAGGVILALATIKPQLVVLLLVWLVIWTMADIRKRYRWLLSFSLTMAALCIASEISLPHWISRFWQAAREYQAYTASMGVMEKMAGPILGLALELLALILTLRAFWKQRHSAGNSAGFSFMLCLSLALTTLLVPTFAVYNQVLLIPAFLWMFHRRNEIWREGGASRLILGITGALVVWPWVSGSVLAAASFFAPQATVERGWAMPFWTSLVIPVGVAALMLLHASQQTLESR